MVVQDSEEKTNNEEINNKRKRVSLSDITNADEVNDKTSQKPKTLKDNSDLPIVSIEKVKNEEKEKNITIETGGNKREKVKLDELIKQTKEEKVKPANEKVIVSEFKKDKQVKESINENEKKIKTKKKEIEKEIELIGGVRTEKDKKQSSKRKHNEVNESPREKVGEINLDVLGVPRAKEPKIFPIGIIKILGYFLGTCFVIVCFMLLPIFEVKEINVTGLNMLSKEEINEMIGFDETKNFFLLYFSDLNEKLSEIPEIKSAEVRYIFPSNIDIKISEIRTAGYIPYLTEYVYIDSDGKVVSITDKKIENVPLIEGLNFSSFKLGNVLETSNEESLKTIIEVTNVLNKYDLLNTISSIDVTDFENITLYVDKIEINIGSLEQCDHKIRVAIEAVNNLAQGVKGYLNVSDTNGRIYFRPIA